LIPILFVFTCIKQSTFYVDSNQFALKFHENNFKRIVPDEYYSFRLHVTSRPDFGREIITLALAAEDAVGLDYEYGSSVNIVLVRRNSAVQF